MILYVSASFIPVFMNSNTMSERLAPYWTQCRWSVWSPRTQPLPDVPKRHWRISLCTACMGRTNDLKLTLPQNVADNEDYPQIEFVVLNYNSRDDLHTFMLSKDIYPHLANGKIKYIRTSMPAFFSMSHARNVAFRAATGDIVSNVDADNFTGKGFATFLNRLANVRASRVIFAKGKRQIHGRLGMFKSEFETLGGYDEDLVGYGGEDHSLLLRAMSAGYMLMWWASSGRDFMRRIVTPREVVGRNLVNPDWRETERFNRETTIDKLNKGEVAVNRDRNWGFAADLEVVR